MAKKSSLDHTLELLSTFLKQLIQTFLNLHFTADLHFSTVLTLPKKNSLIRCSNGLNIQLETTCQHILCSISNNGWIFNQKYWKHSNQLVIDPTTTNVLPSPPHKRHPFSNPLLVLSVMCSTLSTNTLNTHPHLSTKKF